jgi:BNR repeat protein/concanavalin A-like lectin/glucanase superfamily protein
MNKKKPSWANAALVAVALCISACEPVSPTESARMKAWWSADSLALHDGDLVSRWPDSSVNGHDAKATQGHEPNYKIADGVPLVHFGDADSYMTADAADDWRFLHDGSDWTVFIAARMRSGRGGSRALLGCSAPASANGAFAISFGDRASAGQSDAVSLSVAEQASGQFAMNMAADDNSVPAGRWGIVSATFKASHDGSGNEAGLFVNGHQKVSGDLLLSPDRSAAETELSIGKLGLGNDLLTNADIHEIAIFDRHLSEADQYEVLQRLAARLGSSVRIRYPSSRHWLSYDPKAYQAFGIAFRIPTTGKLMVIARQGVSHAAGNIGELRQWESTDRGSTWTSRVTYNSQYDDRNVGGGLIPRTGNIVIFFARRDGDEWVDMRAMRSTDDGETFRDINGDLPANGCSAFSPYGQTIQLPSGRLLQSFYGVCRGTMKAWVDESVDDGLTWTYKADIYNGPLTVNETTLAWISGVDDETSTLLAVSRNDGGAGLLQFVSTDGGATWTGQGLIPDGNTLDVSPWLYRLADGDLLIAWHERSGFTFPIRVGQGSDVAASPTRWGPKRVAYRAATNVIGASGYPAVLSVTGRDEDLVEVVYDGVSSGMANLMINPLSLR